MKYIINTFLFLAFSFALQAQLVVNFESADTMPAPGSKITVDVTVDNFVDINSLQFWLYWDSTVMQFDTITNFAPDLNTSSSTFDLSSINYPGNTITVNGMSTQYPDGQIAVSWENGLDVTTMPDGSAFFSVCFIAIGAECDSTMMTLGDNPPFGEIEVYANFDFAIESNLGASASPLPIQIAGNCGDNPPDPEFDFEYTASKEQVTEGSEVCAFVSVEGFTDVESFQGGITYDPNVLDFKGFDFINVPMGSQGVAESSPGNLSFLWVFDPTTVPDGTQVVKLVFDAVGNVGDISPLVFTDIGNITLEVIGGGNSLSLGTNDGCIEIVEQVVPVFELDVVDGTYQDGTTACIPVIVNNFISITTMQFTLEWDDSVFTYDEKINPNTELPINCNSNINIVENRLNVSWSSPSGGGVTVDDGSVLFEVCFDINADCANANPGDVLDYTIEIVGNPDIEIAAEYSGEIVTVPFTTSDGVISVECDMPPPCEIANIILSPEVTNVGCFGDDSGSVLLSATGGTAPYSCIWEDSNNNQINSGTDCNIQNLTAGTYCVTVSDANDCSATNCVTIVQPNNPISITASGTNATCAAGGSITTNVTGNTGTPNYTWTGGLSGANPTNVNAGSYTVVVTDGNGCTASTSVMVGSVSDIEVNGSSSDVDCDGLGSVSTTVSGGSGNYEYCWSDNPGSKTLANRQDLPAGAISVTVTDTDTGCSDAMSWTIQNTIESVVLTLGTPTNIDCSSGTGSITYTITGGCPQGGQYECELNEMPVACTGTLDNLAPGVYTFEAGDGLLSDSGTFEITSSLTALEIVGTLQTDNVACFGESSGSLQGVNIVGGCPSADGSYTCYIDGEEVPCEDVNTIGLEAGSHTLEVEDSNMIIVSQDFTVDGPSDPVTVELTNIDQTFCLGIIDITPSGGNGGYTFLWSNNETTEDLLDLCPGEYCVTVTDSEDCSAIFCESITQNGFGVGDLVVISENSFAGFGVSCGDGTCDGVVDGTIMGASADVTITLTNVSTAEVVTATAFPINGLCAGEYSVSATDNTFGGTFDVANTVIVTAPEPIDVTIDTIIPEDMGQSNGAVSIFVDGGVGDYTVNWTPNVSSSLSATGLEAGTYAVEVVDGNGCVALLQPQAVVPEVGSATCYTGDVVVTPNGDGVNDIFALNCLDDLDAYNLGMYDRWGREILETGNYNNDWNGLDQDGNELTEGTYFWVLTGTFPNGDTRIFKGSTTLLRQ